VCATVSAEYGLEAFTVYYGAMDSRQFVEILNEIKQRYPIKFAMFCDQSPIHKIGLTRRYLQLAKVPLILNLPRMPTLNPIEEVFSLVKNYFKQRRLHLLMEDKPKNPLPLVK
jgi:hypothetical protein